MNIQQLFFELIQVAIGTRICLSHTPSADEWGELYAMAKKQSLVGVCFAGVHKLQTQRQEPPEMLYLTWIGMAAKIQQRNEQLNQQCISLHKRLKSAGIRSSVLKGQGIASLYGSLSLLRQSGDIDIYVDGGRDMVHKVAEVYKIDIPHWFYKDIGLSIFKDTEVECHYLPGILFDPLSNKRWLKWCNNHKADIFGEEVTLGNSCFITVPNTTFNLVYILLHIYRHMFDSGIGLRQLMDYFFVLENLSALSQKEEFKNQVLCILKELRLMRFASGIMWVMKEVFGIEDDSLLCVADEDEGKFLLQQIIKHGNFGQSARACSNDKLNVMFHMLNNNWLFLIHYPTETISTPFYHICHFLISRINNLIRI